MIIIQESAGEIRQDRYILIFAGLHILEIARCIDRHIVDTGRGLARQTVIRFQMLRVQCCKTNYSKHDDTLHK